MSTWEDEQAEARFEDWNDRTQGGTLTDEQEVIELLNKVDKGYVGITRPKVTYSRDEGLSIPLTKAIQEDGDRNPRFDVDQE